MEWTEHKDQQVLTALTVLKDQQELTALMVLMVLMA